MSADREPCPEFIDVGPFRFECDGHTPFEMRRVRPGSKVTHRATSPGDVGDVDVQFWTLAPEEADPHGT